MIVPQIFYGVECDRCGEICESGDFQYWMDKDQALENATDSEWIELKGKHYCTDCYEQDEETDEYKIYPPYPDVVKKVCDFIKYVVKASVTISEKEDCFILSFYEYHRSNLIDQPAYNWIKAVAPDIKIEKDQILCYITIKKQS